jgi:hypothetical protein
MIYLATGMHRSGSTWQFNALRLLLEHAGQAPTAGAWPERATLVQAANSVIKLHRPDEELAAQTAMIFTCHRDLRDLVASHHRMFGRSALPPEAAGVLRPIMESYTYWSTLAVYDMPYEQMIADKPAELGRLATALGLAPGLDFAAISAEIDALRFESSREMPGGYDAATMLFDGHITNGQHGSWTGTLSAEEVAEIETEYGSWLTAHGYEVT